MALKYIKPLPVHPRSSLFASSLSRDVKNIAEAIDGNTAVLRINSERLWGLARVVDIDAVGQILREMGDANLEIEKQQRKLREIITELRDFIR